MPRVVANIHREHVEAFITRAEESPSAGQRRQPLPRDVPIGTRRSLPARAAALSGGAGDPRHIA
jgi:hypothetical protein